MRNKLLMLCASVVAVAAFAALPAMAAAASPSLENDAGTVLGVPSAIKGVSTNLVFTTTSGALKCKTSTLEGELTVNGLNAEKNQVVEGDISTATFLDSKGEKMCETTFAGPLTAEVIPENLPWCLKATASPADTLTLDGGKCGTTPRKVIAFTVNLFTSSTATAATCTYEKASVTATYNTGASPLVATVSASQTFSKASGSILCPSTGTLTGSFTETTGAGTGLKVD